MEKNCEKNRGYPNEAPPKIDPNTEDKLKSLERNKSMINLSHRMPKTTKLKGYRQVILIDLANTPDVTASKISDDIVSAKELSSRQRGSEEEFLKGYETTEAPPIYIQIQVCMMISLMERTNKYDKLDVIEQTYGRCIKR